MTEEAFEATAYTEPFPHMIINNLYNEEELKLIWEELNFFTKPGKLLEAKDYGGVVDRTNARAVVLDDIFSNHRQMSNILTVNRKLLNLIYCMNLVRFMIAVLLLKIVIMISLN